jgi:hypothetical protein
LSNRREQTDRYNFRCHSDLFHGFHSQLRVVPCTHHLAPMDYYSSSSAPHNHSSIPAGAQPPRNPSQRRFPRHQPPYAFPFEVPQVSSPDAYGPPQIFVEPSFPMPLVPSIVSVPPRPRSRTASAVEPRSASAAPDLQLHRSSSQRDIPRPGLGPARHSSGGANDMYLNVNRMGSNPSTISFTSEEYYPQEDYPPEVCVQQPHSILTDPPI